MHKTYDILLDFPGFVHIFDRIFNQIKSKHTLTQSALTNSMHTIIHLRQNRCLSTEDFRLA